MIASHIYEDYVNDVGEEKCDFLTFGKQLKQVFPHFVAKSLYRKEKHTWAYIGLKFKDASHYSANELIFQDEVQFRDKIQSSAFKVINFNYTQEQAHLAFFSEDKFNGQVLLKEIKLNGMKVSATIRGILINLQDVRY